MAMLFAPATQRPPCSYRIAHRWGGAQHHDLVINVFFVVVVLKVGRQLEVLPQAPNVTERVQLVVVKQLRARGGWGGAGGRCSRARTPATLPTGSLRTTEAMSTMSTLLPYGDVPRLHPPHARTRQNVWLGGLASKRAGAQGTNLNGPCRPKL